MGVGVRMWMEGPEQCGKMDYMLNGRNYAVILERFREDLELELGWSVETAVLGGSQLCLCALF